MSDDSLATSNIQLSAPNTTPEATQSRVIKARMNKSKKAVEKNFGHLEKLEIVWLPLSSVIPNDWNPNRQSDHDFALLCKSMEEDGFTQPVIILEKSNNGKHIIIDGEHRWRAATALSLPEIPCVMVDMTPEQSRISTIRHNRARGSHDIELEASLLRDLQKLGALDIAQDSLLMDDVELNRMLSEIPIPETLSGEDYSEAWVPDDFSEEDTRLVHDGVDPTLMTMVDTGDGMITAMSNEAVDQQRRREKLMVEARTAQDRKTIMKETKIFRLSLIFSGDEADVVKEALGHSPAVTLFEMCKLKVAANA
jgi:hypothetical protein